MPQVERRTFSGLEVRADGDGGPKRLHGLAAPYYDGSPGAEYELWPGVVERYAQGAFADAAGGDDVRVLFNHDPNYILGRTSAGTAGLSSTPRGLEYWVEIADTTMGRDVLTSAARGDINGSSVGMIVTSETWSKESGVEVRTINKASLLDVSPVTFPAYEGTTVQARDIESARASYEDMKKDREEVEARGLAMMAAVKSLLTDI